MTEFTSVFDLAGEEAENEASLRAMAVAKQASTDTQFYLFQAQDETDFGHRVALQEDALSKAASAGGVSVHALVADYTRQFGLVMEAKQAALPPMPGGFGGAAELSEDQEADNEHAKSQVHGPAGTHSEPGVSQPSNPYAVGPRHTGPNMPGTAAKQAEKNAWGTEKSDVDEEGFCPDCERENSAWGHRQHYDNCPKHPKNRKESAVRPMTCPTCNGARGVPAQGHESYHEVSNGQVRCPECAGHGVVHASDEEPDERTSYERYGDSGDYYAGGDAGDAQDAFYDGDYGISSRDRRRMFGSLASIRTALAEGEDPLDWLEQEGGQGQAEKPSEAGIDAVGGKRPFERAAGYYDRENLSPGEEHDFGPTHIDETGPHPRVHTFGSTGEAYDASQSDDRISDGDILHVPSEGVTGFLNQAWPTALHYDGEGRPGEFHGIKAGVDPHDIFGGGPMGKEYGMGDYSETLAKAKAVHEGTHKQGSVRPPF